jgi:probable phosphoglycerate mutase
MLQIVLIRPGCTDYDEQERIQGTLDMPLNEQGRAEVARLIDEVRAKGIEQVYAPASEPAEETGRELAKALDVKFRKIERLANLDFGLWQGMLVDDVRHKQPKVYRQWQEQPENVCPPQGEMLSDADERVRTAMQKLLKRHKEGIIAVVLPEPLLSLARRFVTHGELGDLWKPALAPGGWELLQVEPEAAPTA